MSCMIAKLESLDAESLLQHVAAMLGLPIGGHPHNLVLMLVRLESEHRCYCGVETVGGTVILGCRRPHINTMLAPHIDRRAKTSPAPSSVRIVADRTRAGGNRRRMTEMIQRQ